MPKVDLTAEQIAHAEGVTTALREADAAILAAIRAAADVGVPANEIARRAAAAEVPGYSRPVILRLLGAKETYALVEAALKDGDWEEGDVRVWLDRLRRVRVTLPGNAYSSRADRMNGAGALAHTLREAGLLLVCDEPGDVNVLLADGQACYVVSV
ncbi:hypothetical protein OG339_47270 (plasmid) [Streptosporangium sp. NBC_01495]|uniref:hypothetical protein n=1 Tax=Streptosporangium sp. NBC_01495 TaxID=2903899 RepID=UPI002E3503A8|nr:hypothetical protein [Streptosporangium sp. NBC_01495]